MTFSQISNIHRHAFNPNPSNPFTGKSPPVWLLDSRWYKMDCGSVKMFSGTYDLCLRVFVFSTTIFYLFFCAPLLVINKGRWDAQMKPKKGFHSNKDKCCTLFNYFNWLCLLRKVREWKKNRFQIYQRLSISKQVQTTTVHFSNITRQ